MTAETTNLRRLGHLALSALTGAFIIGAALFMGWFVTFIIMDFIGTALLVGMYYLAWPIAFPLFAIPFIFLLLLAIIPMFKQPFPDILGYLPFLFGILIPIFIVAFAVMLATCPLENGGTLLTTGWDGFSRR